MAREIKFRAQILHTDKPKWVYGSLIIKSRLYGTGSFIRTRSADQDEEDVEYEIYYPTIGQFTGLHNKSGKEIYEGDIIELPNTDICVIEWRDTGFVAITPKTKFPQTRGHYLYWSAEKIIGNIYSNPELLTQPTTL